MAVWDPASTWEGPVGVAASSFPRAGSPGSDDRLQIVNSLDHPDELLRLHQVEGDGPVHALPLWDDALGDVPEHRGLDEAGLDAVPVQGLLGQGEMVRVPGQGVLLVQGEEAVLEGPLDGRFPSPDEEPVGFTLPQVRLPDAEGQVLEVSVPVLHGDGCQPGLHHDPVRPGLVQFGQRALAGGAVLSSALSTGFSRGGGRSLRGCFHLPAGLFQVLLFGSPSL